MAFPGTYNISYYKGDTLEFKIYPKRADGSTFSLQPYVYSYDDDSNPVTPNVLDYDARVTFTISSKRDFDPDTDFFVKCYAIISQTFDYVLCAIRPGDGALLTSGTPYVYDVQIRNPGGGEGGYDLVHTLLTGTVTVTGQVTNPEVEN